MTIHKVTGSSKQENRATRLNLRQLYRGIGPACFQATMIYGAMLGTYEIARQDFGLSVTAAAAAAAFPESMVKGPMEAVKNRSQVLGSQWPKTIAARAKIIGAGTFGMLCREVPGNILYFGAYEYVRSDLGLSPLIAGACAGAAFCVVLPIDAMRAQIVTGRSFRKLEPTYRGLLPYVVRAIAITSILFTSFEAIADQTGYKRSTGKGFS
jgi:hypothetical protein